MYLEQKADLIILQNSRIIQLLELLMAGQQDVSNAIAALSAKVNTAVTAASSEITDVNAKLQQLVAGGGPVPTSDLQPLIDQMTPIASALDNLTAQLQAEDASVKGSGSTTGGTTTGTPASSATGSANTGTSTAPASGTTSATPDGTATTPTSAPGTSSTPTT